MGCGTGSLCAHLAGKPNIGQVRGIDPSPAYIAHAIRTKRDHRVRFEVGDACALPFPDGSFAHSLSLLALQFAPDIDLAVRECVA
ncbi:class I SAM-dependent methyltransferase [Bradyrhizobium guangzhouense]|uniref:class I SAM-dependent methyltransferase n=1 Tax=Bradyrhizobium guangzhouense TaxID=1325095 RepID=UPI0013E8CDCD